MRRVLPALAVALLAAAPAGAAIAVLTTGATFKVVGSRAEGETLYLSLKDGGEVGVPAGLLRGIVPDEVIDELPAGVAPQELHALAADIARRHGLDPELVLAVVGVESAFKPDAVSPKGARGLMQLMPGTAAALGVADALDPAQNLAGGVRHLRWLLHLYGGDLRKALAAYNAGSGAVERYGGVPPYAETRDYVARVLRRYGREARDAGPAPRPALPSPTWGGTVWGIHEK